MRFATPSGRMGPRTIALLTLAAGCAGTDTPTPLTDTEAVSTITATDIQRHTEVLAHDSLEGRAPGTRGGEKAVRYIEAQLRRYGLEPGNPDGTFLQQVRFRGWYNGLETEVVRDGRSETLSFPNEIAVSAQPRPIPIDVERATVVFAGYGTDYGDSDVTGTIVVMLAGVPSGTRNPISPTQKWLNAISKGAVAALIINEPKLTELSDEDLQKLYRGERIALRPESAGDSVRNHLRGWLSVESAERVLGESIAALKKRAVRRGFAPATVAAQLTMRARPRVREFESPNIVALLPGSDPQLRDEYVIYTAHWDHLGRDTTATGDQVFNGAIDNAGGAAQLLAIARAFGQLKEPPRRSVLFIFTTAEEAGLIGAQYYVDHPLYPLERTVANINLDWFIPWGRTRDMISITHGNTSLEDVLSDALSTQKRVLRPDPSPEQGYFLRSDHYPFAEKGIPALFAGTGHDYIGKPAGWGKKAEDNYIAQHYHRESDEIRADWNYDGTVEDTQALFRVGLRVANAAAAPEWKPNTRYKALRDRWLQLRKERP